MGDFFNRLKELSKKITIKFILNDEKIKEFIQEMKDDVGSLSNFEIYLINRDAYPDENIGKLHSKIIIIDNKEILVTSANLTTNAMEKNIESGIWTNDEKIVNSCREVFQNWINQNIFVKIRERKFN